MRKRKELSMTSEIVRELLVKDEKARNSDNYLYLQVIKKLSDETGISIDNMGLVYFLENLSNLPFPCFETVRRVRAKVQELHPEFGSSERVKYFKAKNREAYTEYAISTLW